MHKKTVSLAVAIGMLAILAIPGSASAVTLTAEGSELKAGQEITAVSTNVVMPLGGGVTVSCPEIVLTGETQGEGTEISGLTTSGGEASCHWNPSGAPFTIKAIDLGVDFDAENASVSFVYDSSAVGASNCSLAGTLGASYEAATDAVSVAGGPLSRSGGGNGCLSGMSGFSGSFSLIDPASGQPVYIS